MSVWCHGYYATGLRVACYSLKLQLKLIAIKTSLYSNRDTYKPTLAIEQRESQQH